MSVSSDDGERRNLVVAVVEDSALKMPFPAGSAPLRIPLLRPGLKLLSDSLPMCIEPMTTPRFRSCAWAVPDSRRRIRMRNSATYQKRNPRKPAERVDFSPANNDDYKARLSMTVELQSVALGDEGHVSTPSCANFPAARL